MKKLLGICTVMVFMGVNVEAITLDFTEVDLGSSSQVNLIDQFAAYGVTFDHVYRYLDDRDPWWETGPQGETGYGISNGWWEDNYNPGETGTISFATPVPSVEIDWWTITGTLYVDAYDSDGNLLDSFLGSGYGTETIAGAGLISYMTFHDDGGYVQIANMTYEPVIEVEKDLIEIYDDDGDGEVEVGEWTGFWLTITVTNNADEEITDIVVKDRLGGDLGFYDAYPYPSDIYTQGKTEKVFLEWEIGTLAAGDSATIDVLVYTDINTGTGNGKKDGKQEYTSTGTHELNSGANAKGMLGDLEVSHTSNSVSVEVLEPGDY